MSQNEKSVSQKLEETGKHGIIYGIGSAINSALGFVLIPIYVNYFSTAEYGIFSLIQLSSVLAAAFFHFGSSSALSRFYYDDKQFSAYKKNFSISFFLSLIGALIMLLIISFLKKNISTLLFSNIKYQNHIFIMFMFGTLSIVNQNFFVLIRLLHKSKLFVFVNILNLLITFSITILLLLKYDLLLYAPMFGFFMSQFIIFVFLSIYLYKYFTLKIDIQLAKKYFKWGLPVAASGVVYYLLDWSDRFIIERFQGLSAVGIYSLGYKVAMVIHASFIIPFSPCSPTSSNCA